MTKTSASDYGTVENGSEGLVVFFLFTEVLSFHEVSKVHLVSTYQSNLKLSYVFEKTDRRLQIGSIVFRIFCKVNAQCLFKQMEDVN